MGNKSSFRIFVLNPLFQALYSEIKPLKSTVLRAYKAKTLKIYEILDLSMLSYYQTKIFVLYFMLDIFFLQSMIMIPWNTQKLPRKKQCQQPINDPFLLFGLGPIPKP